MIDEKQAKVTVNMNWWVPWTAGYLFFLGVGGIEQLETLLDFLLAYFAWPILLGATFCYK